MLNRNDIYSIIKRILKYFVFLTVIFMFKQCNAYAYSVVSNGYLGNNLCNTNNYQIADGNSPQFCENYEIGTTWRFKNANRSSQGYHLYVKANQTNPNNYKYILINVVLSDSSIDDLTSFGSNFYHNNAIPVVTIDTIATSGVPGVELTCLNDGGSSFICPTLGRGVNHINISWFHIGSNYNNSYISLQRNFTWLNDDNDAVVQQQQQTNDFLNSNDTTQFDNKISNDLSEENLNQKYDALSDYETFINLPTTLFNSLSNTCQPISLTIPFINSNLVLPCPETMYRKILGDQVINIIKIIVNGIFLYRIIMVVIRLIEKTVDPQDDKLEVVEL